MTKNKKTFQIVKKRKALLHPKTVGGVTAQKVLPAKINQNKKIGRMNLLPAKINQNKKIGRMNLLPTKINQNKKIGRMNLLPAKINLLLKINLKVMGGGMKKNLHQ